MGPGCFGAASIVTALGLARERAFYHRFTLLNPTRPKGSFLTNRIEFRALDPRIRVGHEKFEGPSMIAKYGQYRMAVPQAIYLPFFAIVEDFTFGLTKKLTNATLHMFLGKVAYSAFYTLPPAEDRAFYVLKSL
jgi:hypothetical protein